jgi:3-oxoadipate enol-lactonase
VIAVDQRPEGRIVTIPGRGETFVRVQHGEGPTLLLLHGFTASADLQWVTIYQQLAGRSFIAIDHHGHGRGIRSTDRFTLEQCADDAAAVVRQLGVGPVIAVGYSMGGPISMLFAQRHPDLCLGAVLAATSLEWRGSRRERVLFRVTRGVLGALPSWATERVVRRTVAECIASNPSLGPWREVLEAEYRRGDRRALGEALSALGRFDARSWITSLTVPLTVVRTNADRVVLTMKQDLMIDRLRPSGVDVVELVGDHDVNWSNGDAFAAAIVAAVQSVERRLPDGAAAAAAVA